MTKQPITQNPASATAHIDRTDALNNYQMQEELITLETAQLAKAKGFDIPVHTMYQVYRTEEKRRYDSENNWNALPQTPEFSAPTQSLLQRWLREKHHIQIMIDPSGDGEYGVICGPHGDSDWIRDAEAREPKYFGSYEQALEAALLEGLNRINTGGSHG